LLLPAAARAVEQTHQILKSIVTQAINEVTELQRFVNLKSEILAHSAVTLDRLKESSEATGEGRSESDWGAEEVVEWHDLLWCLAELCKFAAGSLLCVAPLQEGRLHVAANGQAAQVASLRA
jgi:hypothetical protein